MQMEERIICPKCQASNESWRVKCVQCDTELPRPEEPEEEYEEPVGIGRKLLYAAGLALLVAFVVWALRPPSWKWQDDAKHKEIEASMISRGCYILPALGTPYQMNKQIQTLYIRTVTVSPTTQKHAYRIAIAAENRTGRPIVPRYNVTLYDEQGRPQGMREIIELIPRAYPSGQVITIEGIHLPFPRVPPHYFSIEDTSAGQEQFKTPL